MNRNILVKISVFEVVDAFGLNYLITNKCHEKSIESLYDLFRVYLRNNNDLSEIIQDKNDKFTVESLMYGIRQQCNPSELISIKNDNVDYGKKPSSDFVAGGADRSVDVTMGRLRGTTLQSISDSGRLSQGTLNICHEHGLKTVYDIVLFSLQGGQFKQFQNAGAKKVNEFEELVAYHKSTLTDEELETIMQDGEVKTGPQNPVAAQPYSREDSPEEIYKKLLQDWPAGLKKVLNDTSFNEFVNRYLKATKEELSRLPYFGQQTVEEVIKIQEKVANAIKKEKDCILNHPDGKKVPALLMLFPEIAGNDFVWNFYAQKRHLPMLWILEHLLLDNRETAIIEYLLKNAYDSTKKSMVQCAESHSIGVRSLINRAKTEQSRPNRKKAEKMIFGAIHERIDRRLCVPSVWKYLTQNLVSEPMLFEENPIVEDARIEENCGLSVAFALDFLTQLPESLYCRVPSMMDFKHDYRILRALCDTFSFGDFFAEYRDIFENSPLPRTMNIVEMVHVSDCWSEFLFYDFGEVVKIVIDIISKEYGIKPDAEGNIRIPNKDGDDVNSVLYEIIRKHGEPMQMDDIISELRHYLPDYRCATAEQIRPKLWNDSRILSRNRNGTYMLAEWEESGTFKSGTIRDTIIELLQKETEPQDIKTITEYVQRFFPDTNAKSIRSTMIIDAQNRFAQFNGSLYGLSSKKYPSHFVQDEVGKRTFEERLDELVTFLEANGRFPSAKNTKSGEPALLAWWYRCINGELNLTLEQQQKVREVNERYDHLRKRRRRDN